MAKKCTGRTALNESVGRVVTGTLAFLWLALACVSLHPADAHGTSAKGSEPARLLSVANQSIGKKMWYGYGLPSGKLGCAAALSNVLKKAGYSYRGATAVVALRRQLRGGPLEVRELAVKHSNDYGVDRAKLSELAVPGDMIFGYMHSPDRPNSGNDAHCGIVAGSGEVYANDWLDGVWKRDVVDRFFAWYPYIYVIRILGPKSGQR